MIIDDRRDTHDLIAENLQLQKKNDQLVVALKEVASINKSLVGRLDLVDASNDRKENERLVEVIENTLSFIGSEWACLQPGQLQNSLEVLKDVRQYLLDAYQKADIKE